MSGAPTSRSTRSAPPERGMAYRTRVPRSQSPRSSQRWGEPTTRQRGTGGTLSQRQRVRDGRLPEPSGWCSTGELLDIERVPSSSERGRWKSARKGNSLAAYSISRAVRGGAVGKVPARATRRRPTLLPVRFGGGIATRRRSSLSEHDSLSCSWLVSSQVPDLCKRQATKRATAEG
jgi:hypothetical protein